ncbi:hypothetical protein ACEPAH_2564 [Sanghuangporus vaninii]
MTNCLALWPGSNIAAVEDHPDPFKTLGFLRATVHHYYGALSDSRKAVDELVETFGHLQYRVDSSAMKYGLNRLPTELLSRIFLDATSDLKSTIALSHVSKQLRSIVNRIPALWQRFRLSSKWDRERILAVAERSAFRSLKADIRQRGYANDKELDSVITIFSFHSCLEELSISCLSMQDAEEVRRRLGLLHFPSLQVLASESPYIFALLRTLDVDVLPYSSLAGSLVKLSLGLRKELLANLLDFLSCTNALQELSICVWPGTAEAEQAVSDHKPVPLPGLVKLSFETWGEVFMRSTSIVAQKIRCPSLRTLVLRELTGVDTTSAGPFQGILQSNPSFTELQLSRFASIDLCHIPPQVEVLMLDLQAVSDVPPFFKCSGTVRSHQIRLIRFLGDKYPVDLKDCVNHIRDVLLRSGLNGVQFEFQNCRRCRNGIFDLKDVHRAFLGNDVLD